jgi:4-hydroxythreonine-4-phosphate dehydrogenase
MASTDEPGRLLALTQGDPSGIGPDVTLAAWLLRKRDSVPFVVVGDPALYKTRAAQLNLTVPVFESDWEDAAGRFETALPVRPLGRAVIGTPGRPDASDAAATINSIEIAVASVQQGHCSAIVTNPIAKHVLYDAGFSHPGHTEFLGELAGRYWGERVRPVMMLWSQDLAVVPVTIHVPLAEVPRLLSRALIVETARIVDHDLRVRFGIERPRIAVAGLNPHAGEGGSIGREELEVISPALDELRAEGMHIDGPLSADTMFHAEARTRFDVALTMYHDQGLIPIKTLSFDTGVNMTLGLPFVRTSPDHGTAFGIAGRGTANPSSLLAALALAARVAGTTAR